MKTTALSIALAAALFAGASGGVKAHDLQPLIDRATQGDTAAMVEAGEALLTRDRAIEGLMYLEHVVRLGRPEEDVARAHAALGAHYARVTDSPVAKSTSLTHYQQAAVLGHVPSQVRLGQLYLEQSHRQRGKERDATLDRALVVLEHAAARAKDPEAAFLLGKAFLTGEGFKRNVDVGSAWLQFAADLGHNGAALEAGRHLLASSDAAGAIRYLGQAARAGQSDAMMLLAHGYASGNQLPLDQDVARLWAEEAAAADATGAKALLARLNPAPLPPAPAVAQPQGPQVAAAYTTPPSTPSAFTAVDPAATAQAAEDARLRELESRNAQLLKMVEQLTAQVERLASPQSDTPQAPAAAPASQELRPVASSSQPTPAIEAALPVVDTTAIPSTTIQDAAPVVAEAEQSTRVTRAQARALAKLSQNERGLQEHTAGNFAQASRHFARGVRAGDADAMNNLGMLYLQGQGVSVDQGKAMELFRQAAEQGHLIAARNIGYMYQQGLGVRQDLARATVWLRHADRLERRHLTGSNYAGI